jgi:cyclopropane-fatty-acyl-phospholipid synthase
MRLGEVLRSRITVSIPGDPRRLVDGVVDAGRLPEPALRVAIRGLLRVRRSGEGATASVTDDDDTTQAALRRRLWAGPVTVSVEEANTQHYEVTPRVFELMLGPRLKYSSAWWSEGVTDLADAEEHMLALTCRRARLEDGQDVLELGCGWGSLTLYMAEQYPASHIVAVSNSASQRLHIERLAAERGLGNVTVVTADVGDLGIGSAVDLVGPARFDRVISVEMFEHVRNHRELGRRIARWLRPGGELFVHVFAHRDRAYLFETGGAGDWMARHFFTGGMMPSERWIPDALDTLEHVQTWRVDGRHYARTLAAWHERLVEHRDELIVELASSTTRSEGERRWHRWRTFLVACEELFSTRDGTEWGVVHHRFRRPA